MLHELEVNTVGGFGKLTKARDLVISTEPDKQGDDEMSAR